MNDTKVFDMWPKKVQRKCSFCGTTEDKAKNFIASTVTAHCICDKCIKQGKTILDKALVEK